MLQEGEIFAESLRNHFKLTFGYLKISRSSEFIRTLFGQTVFDQANYSVR